MTDVNETIPHLAIAISPKVPSVIAGTGAVITIPKATITLTPNAPTYQKYPLIELLDENGVRIYEIEFDDVMPGQDATTRQIIIRNNTSGTINYSLTPTVTDEQIGKDIETVDSTFFSLDGTSWSKSLNVEVAGDSEELIYIAYMPPSFSKIGEKEWTIATTIEEFPFPEMDGWMVVGRFGVNGSIDGELTDYPIEYFIPYHEAIMNEDFSDIRFKLEDGTDLSYYTKTIVEGESCLFVVKIPVIPESPDSTYVYVFSGNPDATSESNPESVFLFFDDMTGTLGDKWQGGGYACGYGEFNGEQSLILSSTASFRSKTFQASAPFKVELGMATNVSSGGNMAFEYCIGASKYYAQVLYGGNPESIGKGSSDLVSADIGGGSDWRTFLLILDSDGNHTFKNILTNQELTTNDNTYNTGYIGVSRGGAGGGAVKDIMVSKYTPNQPVLGSLEGWTLMNNLNAKGGVVIGEGNTPGINRNVRYGMLIGGNYYE